MLASIASLALCAATYWLLSRTRAGCLIGQHEPGEHWHVIEDGGEAIVTALSCERCGKPVRTEVLEAKWSNESGTLYGAPAESSEA